MRTFTRNAVVAATMTAVAALTTGLFPAAAVAAPQPPGVAVSVQSEPGALVYAVCPAGTQLAGGGYDSIPTLNGSGIVADAVDVNAPGDKPNSWMIKMHYGTARAYALCSPSTSPAPVVVYSGWSAPGAQVSAFCPENTVLTGGGYISNPRTDGSGNVGDAVNSNAPTVKPLNGWAVRMEHGEARAVAMCNR